MLWYFSKFCQKIWFDISCNCLLKRQFAWNVKQYFTGKNKKISNCRLLNLPIAWYVLRYTCICLLFFFSKKKKVNKANLIRKTCLYNFDPLKAHFIYRKTGVYKGIHYFSYFCWKHRLWVLIRTASVLKNRLLVFVRTASARQF